MKYFLWIDGKQDGPFEPEAIREMLDGGHIHNVTLALPEDGGGEWSPIKSFPGVIEPPKPLEPVVAPSPPAPIPVPVFSLPPIEESSVATVLTVIAALEFIAAPIAGLGIGSDDALIGWLVFVSGVISGLILLGFAQVVEHTSESSQRLRRIEILIQKGNDEKDAA